MVSITLSVPDETRELMKQFPEMNWSGFVRKTIEEKASQLKKLEALQKKLRAEQDIDEWAVKLQKSTRSERLAILKRKGLI